MDKDTKQALKLIIKAIQTAANSQGVPSGMIDVSVSVPELDEINALLDKPDKCYVDDGEVSVYFNGDKTNQT